MKIGHMISETNQRLGSQAQAPERLSVSQKFGVIPSSTLESRGMQTNNLDRYKIVMAGDLVLNRFNAYKGALGVAPKTGIVSPDYFTARTLPGVSNARYLDYFIRSDPVADLIKRDMSGMGSADPDSSAFSRFDVQAFLSIKTPGFNLPTQRRIADYLDRETAQIDAMAGALDGLVARLEERRQSQIEDVLHANPQAPTTSVAHGLDSLPGHAFPSERFSDSPDAGYRLLRGINISPEGVRWDNSIFTETSDKKAETYSLHTGDVVLGMDRPFVNGGTRIAKITELDEGSLLVQRVLRIRTSDNLLADYFYYTVKSKRFRDYVEPEFTGISVPHISESQISRFRIPLPPIDEQRRIVAHLDAETAKIDAMIAKAGELRALLDERRSALITATVTGQHPVPEEP